MLAYRETQKERSLPDDRPRLGPWLRRYSREDEPSPRERLKETLLAGAAAVGGLIVLLVVLLAFIRFPVPTLGVLVVVWVTGYVLYLNHKRRAETREQLLRTRLDREDRLR